MSYILASTYGSGNYSSDTYNGSTTTATGGSGTTGSSPTPTTGVLTDTGFDLVLVATLAAALIFAALIVRFWRRPAKSAANAQPAAANKPSSLPPPAAN